MVNSLRLVRDLHVSGWSGHGKEQTANTKRNTKSKATTAMKTTKFFFLTANDNHSPFIFANQNYALRSSLIRFQHLPVVEGPFSKSHTWMAQHLF